MDLAAYLRDIHMKPTDPHPYLSIGKKLSAYLQGTGRRLPEPQVLNAVVSDFAGGDDDILIPIKTLLAKPAFREMARLAGTGKGEVQKLSLLHQLEGIFSEPVIIRLGYFLDGFLGISSTPGNQGLQVGREELRGFFQREPLVAGIKPQAARGGSIASRLPLMAASAVGVSGGVLALILLKPNLICTFTGKCRPSDTQGPTSLIPPSKLQEKNNIEPSPSRPSGLNPIIPEAPINPFLASDAGFSGCSGRAGLREQGEWPETVFAVWDYGAITYRSPDGKSGDRKGSVVVNINGELRTFTYNEVVHFQEHLGPTYMSWEIPGYSVELTYRAAATGSETQGGNGSLRIRSDTPGDSVSIPLRVDRGC